MYKRVVIKVGTNVISEGGRLLNREIENIVRQIADLKQRGVEVVLVTSGAVAAGKGILGTSGDSIHERQVYAAVGQVGLMSLYAKLFREQNFNCAQVLVTKNDFRDREHYANMKATFENLLKGNVVPVVNENDTVAIHELGFSDNDELAGLVAAQLNAEAVLFLSNVNGVLVDGSVVSQVDSSSLSSIEKHVTKERSLSGRGGMTSKFKLAKKLMSQGITVYVANGREENSVLKILSGEQIGTKFIATGKLSGVKRRLAYADGLAKGAAYVNRGAEDVLLSKSFKSLLPVGVTKIEGTFQKGDTIEIRSESGKRIGSGVAQYDSESASGLVGQKGGKALVHYDYLFIE